MGHLSAFFTLYSPSYPLYPLYPFTHRLLYIYTYGIPMPKAKIYITIRPDQRAYLKDNHIVLSPLVRKWIDRELMPKENVN